MTSRDLGASGATDVGGFVGRAGPGDEPGGWGARVGKKTAYTVAVFEFIERDCACCANWWYDDKYGWRDATDKQVTTSYGLFGATTTTSGQAVKHHVGRCREGDDPLRTEESEHLAVTDLGTNQTQVLANYKVTGAFLGDPPTFTKTRTNDYFTSPPIRPSLGGEPYDTIFGDLAAIADLFDEPAFMAVPLTGSPAGASLATGAGSANSPSADSKSPPTIPAALQAQSPPPAGPLDAKAKGEDKDKGGAKEGTGEASKADESETFSWTLLSDEELGKFGFSAAQLKVQFLQDPFTRLGLTEEEWGSGRWGYVVDKKTGRPVVDPDSRQVLEVYVVRSSKTGTLWYCVPLRVYSADGSRYETLGCRCFTNKEQYLDEVKAYQGLRLWAQWAIPVLPMTPLAEAAALPAAKTPNLAPVPVRPVVPPARINITERGLQHVLERHVPGGVRSAGKSLFSAGEDIAALVRQGQGAKVVQQANGNLQRIVDAGKIIGIDRATGLPTSIYTIITDAAGNLVTMFPGTP